MGGNKIRKLEYLHVHFACGKGADAPTVKGAQAMRMLAAAEGIPLDPLFTGKAFAGLLDMNERGLFGENDIIVFVHTGGLCTMAAAMEHGHQAQMAYDFEIPPNES